MKDFDDFEGLSVEEETEVLRSVVEEMGLDNDGGAPFLPLASIPEFCTKYSSRLSLLMLRRYHEWANS